MKRYRIILVGVLFICLFIHSLALAQTDINGLAVITTNVMSGKVTVGDDTRTYLSSIKLSDVITEDVVFNGTTRIDGDLSVSDGALLNVSSAVINNMTVNGEINLDLSTTIAYGVEIEGDGADVMIGGVRLEADDKDYSAYGNYAPVEQPNKNQKESILKSIKHFIFGRSEDELVSEQEWLDYADETIAYLKSVEPHAWEAEYNYLYRVFVLGQSEARAVGGTLIDTPVAWRIVGEEYVRGVKETFVPILTGGLDKAATIADKMGMKKLADFYRTSGNAIDTVFLLGEVLPDLIVNGKTDKENIEKLLYNIGKTAGLSEEESRLYNEFISDVGSLIDQTST